MKYLILFMGILSLLFPTILSYSMISYIISLIIAICTVVIKIKFVPKSTIASIGSYMSIFVIVITLMNILF